MKYIKLLGSFFDWFAEFLIKYNIVPTLLVFGIGWVIKVATMYCFMSDKQIDGIQIAAIMGAVLTPGIGFLKYYCENRHDKREARKE